MKPILPSPLIIIFSCLFLFSCQKGLREELKAPQIDVTFPTTAKDKKQVELIKEVSSIIKKIYKDRKIVYEVVATIYTGYYEDERVLLKDLLYPNYSPLYKTESFLKSKSQKGIFRSAFFTELNKGDYPNLRNALTPAHIPSQPNVDNLRSDGAPDPALEIFSDSYGISIYFPYSENFGTVFTPAYFDNINTDPRGELATVIAADREADEAPGYEPYVCGTRDEQELCYQMVTVNDAYSEFHVTHIVGVGADPTIIMNHDPSNPVQNHLVFIGDVKCKQQYDNLISFNGTSAKMEVLILDFAEVMVI